MTPEVEMTVEQAAAQVWAGTSPLTAAAGAVVRATPQPSRLQPSNGNQSGRRPAPQAHRTAGSAESGCRRARPERVPQVRFMPVCRPWPHAPKKLGTDSAMAR